MELEGSLLVFTTVHYSSSQQFITSPYPEPHQSITRPLPVS